MFTEPYTILYKKPKCQANIAKSLRNTFLPHLVHCILYTVHCKTYFTLYIVLYSLQKRRQTGWPILSGTLTSLPPLWWTSYYTVHCMLYWIVYWIMYFTTYFKHYSILWYILYCIYHSTRRPKCLVYYSLYSIITL